MPPANRVAALGATLISILAAVATLLGAVDTYPKAIALAVIVAAVAAVAIVFLLGAQKSEALSSRKAAR